MANLAKVREKLDAGRVICGGAPLADIASGTPNEPNSCPIANSLKDLLPGITVESCRIKNVPTRHAHKLAAAIGGSVEYTNGTATISSPQEFTDFIRDFDGGGYQQYKAGRW